jgi:Domain of unknown function (DUF4158)
MLRFMAKQVDADAPDLLGYAERDQTRREHFTEVLNEYGWQGFGLRAYRELSAWLTEQARSTDQGMALSRSSSTGYAVAASWCRRCRCWSGDAATLVWPNSWPRGVSRPPSDAARRSTTPRGSRATRRSLARPSATFRHKLRLPCSVNRALLSERQAQTVDVLKQQCPGFTTMRRLILSFRTILRVGKVATLRRWMARATATNIHALQRFVWKLLQDLSAVEGAVTER